jgi:nuclease S1
MRARIVTAILVIGACSLPSISHGFGETGHQVVALIASAQLTPTARVKVDALLALEPGATLASISTWADEHRSPPTAPWHYVNFPRNQSCTYEADRDCPGGNCVVGALERQVAILRSDASAELRLRALKYLVHFVADVHQPLHAGFGDDRGGNSYQLQAFGRGTNLHALWDSGLIGAIQIEPAVLAKELAAQTGAMAATTTFGAWAEESCRIVSEAGFYPARTLPASYVEKYALVLKERLRLAGHRLAAILNGL